MHNIIKDSANSLIAISKLLESDKRINHLHTSEDVLVGKLTQGKEQGYALTNKGLDGTLYAVTFSENMDNNLIKVCYGRLKHHQFLLRKSKTRYFPKTSINKAVNYIIDLVLNVDEHAK